MILQKTDPNCSNIYLIDQNLCLADSLDIINTNVQTLSSNINDLIREQPLWDEVYTLYSQNSGIIDSTIYNVLLIDSIFPDAYTIVSNLSSTWNKPFSLYYPQTISMDSWYNVDDSVDPNLPITQVPQYNSILTHQDTTIRQWLTGNFPAANYVEGQLVYVHIPLYQNLYFNYQFSASYDEVCAPNAGHGATATCSGCGTNPPFLGCNRDIGGVHNCSNAYDYGNKQNSSDSASRPCGLGTGGYLMTIKYARRLYDKHITRVKAYKYKVTNSDWVKST